jgi:hypothetical protein
MSIHESRLKSGLEYGKELVDSAVAGAREARAEHFEEGELASELNEALEDALRPTLIGACAGALVAYLTGDRKSGRNALAGALVGAAVGFSGGMIWGSRRVTGTLARGAMRGVNRVQDRRWLEKNPVVYG